MTRLYPQSDLVEDLKLLANSMSTQKALAKKIGISPAYLHDVLTGRRAPGEKIVKFLGYEKIVCYKAVER